MPAEDAMLRDVDRDPVLIVSASAGTGHIRAGEALAGAFRAAGHGRVEHVDVLDLAPRWLRTAYGGGFELLASRAPRLWRGVYALSDGPDADAARWGPLAHRVLFRAFRRLLQAEPWRACVCTHFLPGQLAAGLPRQPPFSLVITDFTLHRYWVQPRVHDYYVASDDVAADLRARLPHVRVTASGIPIHPAFASAPDRATARRAAGIADGRPVALVMGGGLGIGVAETALDALRAGPDDTQVIAVCGRNGAARARLAALGEPRLMALGYTPDIPALIAAADVVITKPGGLTCSEALALGRPLILTRAIPGHEEANIRALVRAGAALHATSREAVGTALRRVLAAPGIAAAAQRIGRPAAAAEIVTEITRRTGSRAAA